MGAPPVNAIPLHAGNPGPMTGGGNWTYLIPGRSPVLIDAGVGNDAHLEALLSQTPAGPAQVLVTHIHPDHASGAPALARRAPAAAFAKFPWVGRDAEVSVPWRPLADGEVVETGEGPLRVVHTPGHAPDHVVFWHEASATAFTGDLLVLGSTVVIPASHGGVLADYLRSLERVAALGIRRAWPAHGPVIEDPLALIARYLAHRHQREQQVREVLSAGPARVADIVARLYYGLDPALLGQAHESVLAHLEKLAADGLAARADAHGFWHERP
jgi:glyoxylase-like metal-dependent hydrolase (beta-lactamase superfamily II)